MVETATQTHSPQRLDSLSSSEETTSEPFKQRKSQHASHNASRALSLLLLSVWARSATLLVARRNKDVPTSMPGTHGLLPEPVYHQWPCTRHGLHTASKLGVVGTDSRQEELELAHGASSGAHTSAAPAWTIGVPSVAHPPSVFDTFPRRHVTFLPLSCRQCCNPRVLYCCSYQSSRPVELPVRVFQVKLRNRSGATSGVVFALGLRGVWLCLHPGDTLSHPRSTLIATVGPSRAATIGSERVHSCLNNLERPQVAKSARAFGFGASSRFPVCWGPASAGVMMAACHA